MKTLMKLIDQLEDEHPGPKFMGKPDAWYDVHEWYCECLWHGPSCVRAEEGLRDRCPVCGSGVLIGPPPGTLNAEKLLADLSEAKVRRIVKEGDLVTHERCMGCIEEHIITGWDLDHRWLCGTATLESVAYGAFPGETDDISPRNVLYINRAPVAVADQLVCSRPKRKVAGRRR